MADSTSRLNAAAFLLFLLVLNAAHAKPGPWTLEIVKLPSPPVRLFMGTDKDGLGQLQIQTRKKGWFYLSACNGAPCARALKTGYRRSAPPADALPDASVATGKRNIIAAWLAAPTRRYAHGVLGDAIEAGMVVVEDAQGKRHRLTLPSNAVFEDRYARLADLDGDGRDEIIVVKSTLTKGAALAVLALAPHGLEIAAQTPPIGQAHRWLNPAGIADYDGDGHNEIALVVTPHIGGRLEFWEYRNRKLQRKARLYGFSNHVIGSRAQKMSASADFDGDGVTDLALPSQDRRALRIISLAGGAAMETAKIALPGRVVTEILLMRRAMVMGLDTGQLVILRR